jgi:hypothetical protein
MPPSIFPTGVTIYRPEKSYNCYVLFDGRDTKTYLIDMNGNEVNNWSYCGFPAEMINPKLTNGERGHIFAQKEPDIFANETLLELDWNGNKVWEWGEKAPGGKAQQNHDLDRLPNGNTLVLAKLIHVVPTLSNEPLFDQAIYEVNMDGDIVWKWVSSDHIEELGFSTMEAKELILSKKMRPRSSLFVINNMQPLGQNKWYKAGDERFHPDNIMIDSREASFIAIIDKNTGTIVWRMGPDYKGAYDFSERTKSRKVPISVALISGQHDAHMIPEGMPGAGNIMVFDNHGSAGFPPFFLELFQGSKVLEIDPITFEIVWQYDASSSGKPLWTFFSSFISSARRLPNGNTLICEGMHGRIFQVTPTGEIVWEYINPHFGEWADHDTDSGGNLTNFVFRAQPVPYDWVPEGIPHSEKPITPPKLTDFHIQY